MAWWLLLIPLSSAFSCWLLVKLFLVILFRPVRPIKFGGLTIHGIVPSRQPQIAKNIASLVSVQFLSILSIDERVSDPTLIQKIMPTIEEHIDDFLRNKLKKEMPVISMFIGDKTITSLKQVFMNELEKLFPQVMGRYASNLVSDLNIEEVVNRKLAAFPPEKIESLFYEKLGKEIRLAYASAMIIGLITGTIAMLIILLVK
jgi:uncharacterized membrane protein YheB (UPF0754 family)